MSRCVYHIHVSQFLLLDVQVVLCLVGHQLDTVVEGVIAEDVLLQQQGIHTRTPLQLHTLSTVAAANHATSALRHPLHADQDGVVPLIECGFGAHVSILCVLARHVPHCILGEQLCHQDANVGILMRLPKIEPKYTRKQTPFIHLVDGDVTMRPGSHLQVHHGGCREVQLETVVHVSGVHLAHSNTFVVLAEVAHRDPKDAIIHVIQLQLLLECRSPLC